MIKHLFDTCDMTRRCVERLFEKTDEMHAAFCEGKKAFDTLSGRSVALLFYEASTRTAVSFEKAAQFLGAHVTNISVMGSSVQKGESLVDTARTLSAFHTDLVVIRHGMAGAARVFADAFSGSVINGGDGMHAHPTQALYDMYTAKKRLGDLEGKKAVIIGDIKHSRVARSNIDLMLKFGVTPWVYGPKTLMPDGIEALGARVAKSMAEALDGAEIVMALRIQRERQSCALFPSVSEYRENYGLNADNIRLASGNAIVMHPGPVNRGVELSEPLISSEICVKDLQAEYGIALRAALMKEMLCPSRVGGTRCC